MAAVAEAEAPVASTPAPVAAPYPQAQVAAPSAQEGLWPSPRSGLMEGAAASGHECGRKGSNFALWVQLLRRSRMLEPLRTQPCVCVQYLPQS